MTVETTVQEMFDRYPLMYSTLEECFDHFFCTIGNSYEWKWGQLVDRDRGNPDYDEEYERRLNEDDYSQKRRGRARQSKKNIEAKQKRDELLIKAGILESASVRSWYPLSRRYSRLFTIPDDAKDD